MQGIINVAAFVLLAVFLSQKTNRPIVASIPTIWCLYMIILLVLSCFHAMNLIDALSLLVILYALLYLYSHRHNMNHCASVKMLIFHPSTVVIVLLIFSAVLLARNAAVYAWDDVNYWGASVRALFERNGLEGKHYTVSSGWGDYPLGQQLIEWWFLHSFGGEWKENLLFIGYYALSFSFVAPFFTRVTRNPFSLIGSAFACIVLILIHIDGAAVYRLNADLLTAIMYGSSVYYILQVLDSDNCEINRADVFSISIQLAGLAMIKSIGIFWSLTTAILFYMLRIRNLRDTTIRRAISKFQWFDYGLLIPTAFVYILWEIMCKLLDRATYLVGILRSSRFVSIEWHLTQAKIFVSAVFLKPAVQFHLGSAEINISLGILIFIPLLLSCYLVNNTAQHKSHIKNILIFSTGVSIAYLGILMVSYQTMFAYEPQAIDSVFRYALPCIILNKVVLWYTYDKTDLKGTKRIFSLFAIFLILFVSYGTPHLKSHIAVIVRNEENYNSTKLMYKEKYTDFYAQLEQVSNRYNSVVYYFANDVTEYDRIHLCYLAEGTAVNRISDLTPETVLQCIAGTHTSYVWISQNDVYSQTDYQPLMQENCTFDFGTLYQTVTDKDGRQCLQSIQ